MKGKILFLLIGAIAFFSLQGVSYVEPISQAPSPVIFKADLTQGQEIPVPAPSLGVGAGVFVLNTDPATGNPQLEYAVSFTGLMPFAAHFHAPADCASTAPVRRTICSPCTPGILYCGAWKSTDAQPLTAERVQDLLACRVYVNVHTPLNPGGEIRGNLVRVNQ